MIDEQFLEIQNSLGRIQAQLESIIGNGQPGRLGVLEDKVEGISLTLAENKGKQARFIAYVSTFVSAAITAILRLFHH